MTVSRCQIHDGPIGEATVPLSGTLLLAAVLATAVGCSANEPPDPVPFPTASEAASAGPAPEEAGPNATEPEAEPGSESRESASESAGSNEDSSVIVIESGADRKRKTLWEAAQAERARRETARPPVASVTDENLHEYQDVELTFVEPSKDKGEGTGDGSGEPPADGDPPGAASEAPDAAETEDVPVGQRGEQYWRERVLDVRLRLRAAVDEVEELEREAASLRRSFYAEDDPYIRDGRIKQAWDRALGRLATARREVDRQREELAETLEEGRRAGALPGWLREGIELEPSFEEDDARRDGRDEGGLPIHRAEEPETVEPTEPPDQSPERQRP